MECRKSEHTLQVDPFKLTKLRRDLPEGEYLHIKMNCWEINEHDILLVVLQSLNFGGRSVGKVCLVDIQQGRWC